MNKDERIVLTVLIVAVAIFLSIWVMQPSDFAICVKAVEKTGMNCKYSNN